jgi:hypothetical protein
MKLPIKPQLWVLFLLPIKVTIPLSFFLKSARFDIKKADIGVIHSDKPEYDSSFCNPVIEGVHKGIGIAVKHEQIKQARYRYDENVVFMPLKKQYPEPSHYYYELFHEIAHAKDYLDGVPGALNYFYALEAHKIALRSDFNNVLAPNTDALIEKFYSGGNLQDVEKTLLCAYIKEEYKADMVSIQMLKIAGYTVPPVVANTAIVTGGYARDILSKFEGKDFQAEVSNLSSAYHKEVVKLGERLETLLHEVEQELGLKSKDYLKSTGIIAKDNDREM